MKSHVVSGEVEKAVEEDGSNPQQLRFCRVCSVWMQPDSAHCPLSNICVKRYGGFAAIIDRPIGKYTFGLGLLFLGLLGLNCGLLLVRLLSSLL